MEVWALKMLLKRGVWKRLTKRVDSKKMSGKEIVQSEDEVTEQHFSLKYKVQKGDCQEIFRDP
jgi:hypothetical protein